VSAAGALQGTGSPTRCLARTGRLRCVDVSADSDNLFAQRVRSPLFGARSRPRQPWRLPWRPPTTGVLIPPSTLDPRPQVDNNPLAKSLQTVARVHPPAAQRGSEPPGFFVSWAGFDTHDTQAKRHSILLSQLGAAFEYFDQLMITAGLSSNVTLLPLLISAGRSLLNRWHGSTAGAQPSHRRGRRGCRAEISMVRYPVVGSTRPMMWGRAVDPDTAVEQYGGTWEDGWASDSQVREFFPISPTSAVIVSGLMGYPRYEGHDVDEILIFKNPCLATG